MSGLRITIIGLGKIGASLGLALRGAGHTVTGCDRLVHVAGAAVARGAADAMTPDPISAATSADIVILATPITSTIELIPRLTRVMRKDALLLDTGSVKTDIVAAMNVSEGEARCVGGHPIAGSDKTGFESWDSTLFDGRVFSLTETRSTDNDARNRIEHLVKDIGARPHWFDAAEHDDIVATTSHLPLLIAVAMTRRLGDQIQSAEKVDHLVGGQLKSVTRMSDSSAEMLGDIFRYNEKNIRKAVDQLGRDALDVIDDARDESLELSNLAAIRKRLLS